MSNEVKRQYLVKVRLRYLKGTKKQKTLILDEFCQVCEISRKHAIKLMAEEIKTKTPRPGAKYTPDLTELRVTVEKEFMDLLEDLKNLYSQSHPDISVKELLRMGLELLHSQKDPARAPKKATGQTKNIRSNQKTETRNISSAKASETEKAGLVSASEIEKIYLASGSAFERSDATPMAELKNSRSIPAKVRRAVWKRDNGSCHFKSSVTGQVCGSKKFLEIDHVLAFSLGGRAEIDNIQLLCDQHNRRKSDSFRVGG